MSLIVEFLDFVEGERGRSRARLLGRILTKCRQVTGAEAGAIYLVQHHGGAKRLAPASIQNDAIQIKPRYRAMPAAASSIAAHVANSERFVIVDDVHQLDPAAPYQYLPGFEIPGYRTHSVLCFPIRNAAGAVICVVELTNRRDAARDRIIPFAHDQMEMLAPVARVLGGPIEHAGAMEQIAAKNAKLRERNRQLRTQRRRIVDLQEETEAAFMLSINLLARAAGIHDEDTGNHIIRVNEYSHLLAQELGMPRQFREEIRYSAQLHDVGKMSVDAAILKKQGHFTDAERDEMRKHPIHGFQILSHSPRLRMAAEIALYHHEKWDGTGYPHGVAGEAIPISARIVAVADTYDALRAARSYKPGFDHARAVDIIVNGDERIDPKGHFDPRLVAVVRQHHERLDAICRTFIDQPPDVAAVVREDDRCSA